MNARKKLNNSTDARMTSCAFIAWGLVICFLDQLSKWFMVSYLQEYHSIEVIPRVFHLTLVYNRGAAFGTLQGQQWFLIGVSAIVVLGMLLWHRSLLQEGRWAAWAYALIWGGALGNLIDRIRLRSVVDFLDFRVWPVFNIADSAICIGVGVIILCFLFSFKKDQ